MRKLLFLFFFFGLLGFFGVVPVARAVTMYFEPSNETTYNDWQPENSGTLTFTATVSGLHDRENGFSAGSILT